MIGNWKRPAAFFLAAAMMVTMSGVPASAVEPDGAAASGHAPAECSCETHCEQGVVDPDCPVCGIEGADLTQCQSEANAITVEKVQELIDALPATDKLTTMTKDEQNAVYADLQAAYEAYQALTEDEQALLTGTEVFESLFHFFNGMVNLLATANGVSYLDENGDEQTADNVTVVESGTTAWNGGWYVVNDTVTIGSRVAVSGAVHLILADGASLTVNGGINVAEGNSFSVYAQSAGENMGALTATGGENAAGIGGGSHDSGGNITIHGGSVTATGGESGAGIGSGGYGSYGNITIHGGSVAATGGFYGAGIGTGIGGGQDSSGGNITIHGGSVAATGGDAGAGIGSGYRASVGNITIHGGNVAATSGNVTASGGYPGAGIGSGFKASVGNITINGGTVTATGGNVTATGQQAAGIGSGFMGSGGSFTTGTDGHALIVASNISDKSQRKRWSGMIFEGDTGEVYGNPTIQENIEIPSGKTLTVPKNITLTVKDGVTLTNSGTITNNGTIKNNGTINGRGTVEGNQPLLPPPPVSYRTCDENGQNWETKECRNYTVVESSMTAWNGGWYVVSGTVTIDGTVTVSGEVHLILADNASLTANDGINVAENNSFIVYAQSVGENMGTLTATSSQSGEAGIGGNWENAGTITINGGTVKATGEEHAAGIGGGNGKNAGTITINGGNVTATGGQEAAGIGGGFESSVGNITINGGTVTATGGDAGAGIGSGSHGSYGNITIHGGSVTATGGESGAGIGSGGYGSYGNITIHGGSVAATGGFYGAGIGTGIGGGQDSSGGNITIHGGSVAATGGDAGAGIGSGYRASVGNITIHGGNVAATSGNVTASGGYPGAGIGSGFKASVGNITINGGTVTATGGNVTATGQQAAGIGSGFMGSGGSFTTGTDGHALIFANGGIADKTMQDSWSGIIFDENDGKVYKNQTLQENFEIPLGKTLTVPQNTTLTIPQGVTLTNNGTITGNGTLGGEGNLVGSGTVAQTITNNHQKDSAVSVTVSPSPATYGSKVSITATISKAATISRSATISKAANAITRAAENQVEFFVGTDSNKKSLGTANVSGDTATLSDVEISQEKGFAVGENTITAEYGGSMGLKPQTGSTRLTVQRDLKDAIVTVNGEYFYTNSPIIPEVSVTWNGTQLTENTDYTVNCTDNTNAGKATVTVSGKGNYTGTKTGSFTIAPAQLNDATVKVNGTYTYTGQAQTPASNDVVVTLGGKTVPSNQYTISASDNMNAGQATATVTAKAGGNYTGSASGKFTIALASLNDAKVEVSGGPFTYDGTSKNPTVAVTLDSKTLSASTDYTLSYSNSNGGDGNLTNAGTVTVTATGTGNYTGTATASGEFTIKMADPTYTTPTGLTAVYGETLADVALPTGWAWDNLRTSVGNVGENTFPATYNKDSSGNYNPVQQNLTVKVSPASYKITLTGQADSPAQITLNEAVVEPGNTGAAVSYGYSTAADTDPSTWQTGRVFSGLTADTTYYFFAKVGATTNYAETISTGVAITTPEKEVSSISIQTQPAKLAYTSGQTLDLNGLSVQVSYSDNTSKTIGWDSGKLTAEPAQGTVLTVTGHSGKTVTISYGGKTAKTDALTVGKAEQAALSITGKPTTVYNGDTFTLTTTGGSGTGTVTWEIISGPATVDANGKVTVTGIGEIQIKAVKAADTEYAQSETTIALTAVKKPSSGGGSSSGGGGGSSSSGGGSGKTDTTTTTKPDGTKVQTETKKDGTKIQTETKKDGSVTKTTTNPNGSSVTENKAADGSTGTVKTDKHGQTTAETALSSKAIETAKRNGEPVKAPVEVKASRDSSTAPTVKVDLPKNSGDTKVEIPVSNVKPGTVAVLVHADGTEEIVKNSLPTEDGIQLTINGGATVKIVDNSKDFADTRNHWAKDAIDFVSARGLVNGMSATIYAPNASTTRAQLWTILARQNNADLTGGATWFENAQNWAKEKGISDGTNPNGTINRAQMVTMLWRAMGQPAAASGASFADVPADSYYAQAVAWAIENGITAGVGGGRFDPNSTCTRAQIVTFLYRSYQSK